MRCSAEKPNMRGAYCFLLTLAIALSAHADPRREEGLKPFQIITGSPEASRRAGWDRLFDTGDYVYGVEPAPFVVEAMTQIAGRKASRGLALDIAAGEGRNAVYLAKKGYRVEAVDFSEVALRKARRLARTRGVKLQTINEEMRKFQFKDAVYDVILNINFIDREITESIRRALKPGGFLVYENHTVEHLSLPSGASTPREYVLAKGELRAMFGDFEILIYRETNDGRNAVASLLAVKR